jgi:hypothetical protein
MFSATLATRSSDVAALEHAGAEMTHTSAVTIAPPLHAARVQKRYPLLGIILRDENQQDTFRDVRAITGAGRAIMARSQTSAEERTDDARDRFDLAERAFHF